MNKSMKAIWMTVCAALTSTACTLSVFASEAAEDTPMIFVTLDVLQKVFLMILIAAVVLLLVFYVVKAVLKKLYVEPENKDDKQEK